MATKEQLEQSMDGFRDRYIAAADKLLKSFEAVATAEEEYGTRYITALQSAPLPPIAPGSTVGILLE